MSLRRMKQEIVEELKAELYNIIEEALVEEALVEESKTVKIGKLEWMTENYNDVKSVPLIRGREKWIDNAVEDLPKPACSVSINKTVVYNWYALEHLKIPSGWRIPTAKDWETLKGKNLEELNWNPQHDGLRAEDGVYEGKDSMGFWWTATEKNEKRAIQTDIVDNSYTIRMDDMPKTWAMAVRLVRG